jgi:hypothetical protein
MELDILRLDWGCKDGDVLFHLTAADTCEAFPSGLPPPVPATLSSGPPGRVLACCTSAWTVPD